MTRKDMLPAYADDKHPTREPSSKSEEMLPRPGRRNRPFLAAFGAVALCYLLYSAVFSVHGPSLARVFCHQAPATHELSTHQAQDEKPLVPLEAHIMSKCPDAKDCLTMMVLPTMQKVYDKVNFTLSYIGTPTDNDGVACMHGPEECMGNIIELCAARLYPDPKTYLGFTMCLTYQYKDIPQQALVEDCALEHGIEFQKLNDCAVEDSGGLGIGMLRASVRRSTAAGVTKSCTVRLNEEIYCIRDGGKWSDCPNGSGVNDLIIAVEKLYRQN